MFTATGEQVSRAKEQRAGAWTPYSGPAQDENFPKAWLVACLEGPGGPGGIA